jgi:serine/threonine-protein kinase
VARTPEIVGRYAIYDRIASGGMASVHFARLLGPSGFVRTVAAKRAHPHIARDPEFAPMFLDEARLAARIRHANVVSTLDVLREDDELVLVMDYVHGESLWKLVETVRAKGERVPLAIAASIVVDTLHALQAAHDATDEAGRPLGIVHRDVSPHNILVGVDGVTRLVDFGIAKAEGRLHSTKDHAVRGKYAYMAPEQARGEAVSGLTDTYATAIVFWELLTGERLFEGKTDAETIHKCLVVRARPPSALVPELPRALDAIVKRGLARAPDERYPTARAFASDIEACVPAVRASEVGAWVRRVAGAALSKREAVLAEIERDAHDASARGAASAPTSTPIAQTAFGAEATIADAPPARSRGRGGWIAAGVAVVGAVAAFAWTRSTAQAIAAPAASGIAASFATPALAAITVASAAPSATAPTASATAPIATAPVASASVSAPVAPRPTARPALPPKRPRACNPPYSIDAQGRQIFKPECM